MKKILVTAALGLALAVCLGGCDILGTAQSQPPEEQAEPVALTFEERDGAYTLTGVGAGEYIEVPAEYEGLPVTAVGEEAFAYMDCVEVTLPDTVTVIGKNAFRACGSLTAVKLGVNSKLERIEDTAFCDSSVTDVYLPASCVTLGLDVFNNCAALASIRVSDRNPAYSSEGNCLFERETGKLLRGTATTQIPSAVKEIGAAAFRLCTGIETLYIPETVTAIGNYAFWGSSLKELRYAGSEAQWEEVSKARLWDMGASDALTVSFLKTV